MNGNDSSDGQAGPYRVTAKDLNDIARVNRELAALHRDTAQRAAELERINRDLSRRQAAMVEYEARQRDFVDHVVHDLSTPLTSIHGIIDLALDGSMGALDHSMRSALLLARASCERLTRMIGDVLALTEVEGDQLVLKREALAVNEVIGAVVREQLGFDDDAMTLRIEADAGLSFIGDGEIVHRVLDNLVTNALKFSPPAGPLTLTAQRRSGSVRVSVTDAGPGIAPEDHDRLFKKFSRIERRGRSTGLGLAFCRQATEAMGGHVGVVSAPGEGSTFWFELPAAE